MKLYEIAPFPLQGIKGNISVISLIPFQEEDYEMLKKQVTAERVKGHFSEIVKEG